MKTPYEVRSANIFWKEPDCNILRLGRPTSKIKDIYMVEVTHKVKSTDSITFIRK